jgi:ribosomal protein S18 acetylase RimI-like enzyme
VSFEQPAPSGQELANAFEAARMSLLVHTAAYEDEEAAQCVADKAFATVRSVYRPASIATANLATMSAALERLVADDRDQIVGTVRFRVLDGCLRVMALAVQPDCRRRGIARALVDRLMVIAKDRGCRALTLYTVTQTGNVPIFERLGFKLVCEQPDTYSISVSGEPLTEAYLERAID